MLGRLLCAGVLAGYLIYTVYMSQLISVQDGNPGAEYIDASHDGHINTSTSSIITINAAHSNSIPHRGVWIYIVDENDELLLLKRSTETVTCPNTWGFPGEHTKHNESYLDTAYRGVLEELGLTRHHIISTKPLFKEPLYLDITYFGPRYKHDLQWSMSFLMRVKKEHIYKYNHESALMQWKPVSKVKFWMDEVPSRVCVARDFKYSSTEFNVTNAEWSFKEAFEFHLQLIKPLL